MEKRSIFDILKTKMTSNFEIICIFLQQHISLSLSLSLFKTIEVTGIFFTNRISHLWSLLNAITNWKKMQMFSGANPRHCFCNHMQAFYTRNSLPLLTNNHISFPTNHMHSRWIVFNHELLYFQNDVSLLQY